MSATIPGELYARDRRALASSQLLRFFPLEVASGEGAVLRTPVGQELIDLSAGWGAATTGYAHPRVVEAVSEEVALMPGAGALSATSPTVVSLAERLIRMVPGRGRNRAVHFGLTGSDANSAVLRAVRAWSDRERILIFENSYHGGLGPAQHASGFYIADGVTAGPGVDILPYADLGIAEQALQSGDYAAVLVEPIMADGGVVIPPRNFLPGLREACDLTGTLLVVDEVKVGAGRTGHLLASLADGVEADIVTLGKGLGGGLPLSAAIAPSEIWDAAPGASLLTMAGSPITAAAGHAVLDALELDDLIVRAAELGEVLTDELSRLAEGHTLISDVRSRGLVGGIELTSPDGTTAFREAAGAVHRAHELGAIAYCVGPDSNVIELTPPLVITAEQLRQGLEVIGTALADVQAGRVNLEEAASYGGW